jgi:glycosyltransferase involved in cell wall biosynthesis
MAASEFTSQPPCFKEIGVIGIVPDNWDSPWMPRHHILSRLAKYFQTVWVNPTIHWRAFLASGFFGGLIKRNNECRELGFSVCNSLYGLPGFYRPPTLARFTNRMRLLHAKRLLLNRGCRKIILYLWRPEFQYALDFIRHDLSCYHIDDEYTFSAGDEPVSELEIGILRRVHLVFIHSPGLLAKKGAINSNTFFAPNGADYTAYSTPHLEPPDLQVIPHPRVGYTGFLKKQLDWALLRQLILANPQWNFVFVGPQRPDAEIVRAIRELMHTKNAFFLGEKSIDDLPRYPQHFDVCVMPYRASAYTAYIYPLKLHEYLASGRPIVGTRIRSLEDFDHLVALVDTPEEWSQALAEALSPTGDPVEKRAERQECARKYDWNSLVFNIAKIMATRLSLLCPDVRRLIERWPCEKTTSNE